MRGIETSTYERERELQQELSTRIEAGIPGIEVLAVELLSPARFCVYVDHPDGVDHALCQRVTGLLRDYRERYTVDVSSPGLERPLRKPAHFRNAVGRRVTLRTSRPISGRTRLKGEVIAADERSVRLLAGEGELDIPYDTLVRGNLIDEG
ncbi:MAG: ribosome maturation factor RimP [Gaiellaceae bacterium]